MEIEPLISTFLIFPLDMCFDVFTDLQYVATNVKLF